MLKVIVFWVGVMGVLFLSAGRLDLPFFWVYGGILLVGFSVAGFVIDPSLRRERLKPGPGGIDRNMRWVALPLIVGQLVFAGLDVGRLHWSDCIPVGLRCVGLVGLAASYGLLLWAMKVNLFFSPVVRIQHERGHQLVTRGPYRFVRHPGYAACMLCVLFMALALGSWWAMVFMALFVLLILRRTRLEDRFLHDELEGYDQYAGQVRYRLIPGVW